MPIGPNILTHNSSEVEAFVAESFGESVKRCANKLINSIDGNLLNVKPDPKAKRCTFDLWDTDMGTGETFDAVSDLVKKAYIEAGWLKMEITDLGYDRFQGCIRVRLYRNPIAKSS